MTVCPDGAELAFPAALPRRIAAAVCAGLPYCTSLVERAAPSPFVVSDPAVMQRFAGPGVTGCVSHVDSHADADLSGTLTHREIADDDAAEAAKPVAAVAPNWLDCRGPSYVVWDTIFDTLRMSQPYLQSRDVDGFPDMEILSWQEPYLDVVESALLPLIGAADNVCEDGSEDGCTRYTPTVARALGGDPDAGA